MDTGWPVGRRLLCAGNRQPCLLPAVLHLLQLPPKRRQVIRLPKPPPSEWPKRPKGAKRRAASSSSGGGDSGSEAEGGDEACEGEGEGGDGGNDEDKDGGGGQPGHMSSAHRTGLAKASAVVEWLMTALGSRGGRGVGGRRAQVGGRSKGRSWDAGIGLWRAQQGAHSQPLPPVCVQGEDDGDDAGSGGGGPASDAPKLLVFAHHKTVMNRLAAALEGATGYAPVGYVRIDGSTDPEDRWVAADGGGMAVGQHRPGAAGSDLAMPLPCPQARRRAPLPC